MKGEYKDKVTYSEDVVLKYEGSLAGDTTIDNAGKFVYSLAYTKFDHTAILNINNNYKFNMDSIINESEKLVDEKSSELLKFVSTSWCDYPLSTSKKY